MFETALKSIVKTVFDFDKVTFDRPAEASEQECIFIEVSEARPTIKDGEQLCRVNGRLRVFANAEKMPFGYLMKKIRESSPALTKDLFFFDFEANAGVIGNIVERSMSFEYFYNSQYDPDLGTITSIDIEGDYS